MCPFFRGKVNWKGKVYQGIHTPLVSRELWNPVQDIMDGRFAKRPQKSEHDFVFSSLISCGHCGCSLVGEIKKGRYVYYHCTGFKGKCAEPYTREEVLEEHFSLVLKRFYFDDEVMEWVADALKQSHGDEKRYHEEAIIMLQTEYNKLQGRIDAMYMDKLDGRVDAGFFDRKAKEWRTEQDRIMGLIGEHQSTIQTYLEEGIRILELSQRASELFQKQEAYEKRRLHNFLLSN